MQTFVFLSISTFPFSAWRLCGPQGAYEAHMPSEGTSVLGVILSAPQRLQKALQQILLRLRSECQDLAQAKGHLQPAGSHREEPQPLAGERPLSQGSFQAQCPLKDIVPLATFFHSERPRARSCLSVADLPTSCGARGLAEQEKGSSNALQKDGTTSSMRDGAQGTKCVTPALCVGWQGSRLLHASS